MSASTLGTPKKPGEVSGIGASIYICILHNPPKSEMTSTLLNDSPIRATGSEYKKTQIHTLACTHTHIDTRAGANTNAHTQTRMSYK
jgi:hypothetical protein